MSAKSDVKKREFLAKPSVPENVVTVNFVEDGLTALGWSWYRGESLSVERGTTEWDRTTYDNDEGERVSWLDLDEDGQLERWGVRFFREGKWKGLELDLSDPDLTPEEKATLAAVTAAEQAPAKIPAAKRGPGRPPKGMPVVSR